MRGSNTIDGSLLEGPEYLRQAITDVLMTPVGSRVMRPSYGSRLFFLLGSGMHEENLAEINAAIVEAVVNCVPSITPRQVILEESGSGFVKFSLSYADAESGEEGMLRGVEVAYTA